MSEQGLDDDPAPSVAPVAPENPEKLALQSKKLQKLQKAYEKRGIIYVSRIPPHMVTCWPVGMTSSARYTTVYQYLKHCITETSEVAPAAGTIWTHWQTVLCT